MIVTSHISNKRRIIKTTLFLAVVVALLFSLTYVKELPLMQDYTNEQNVSVSSITTKFTDIVKGAVGGNQSQNSPITVSAGVAGVQGCGLTLQVSSESNTANSNNELNTTLTIKNEGKSVCNQASISAFYSNNQTFISSNPQPASSDYYWKFGDLNPESNQTISIRTKLQQDDENSINTEFCLTAHNSDDVCATIKFNETQSVSIDRQQEVNVEPFNPNNEEYGVWIWTSPYQMSSNQKDSLISKASASGFNVIYLTIDDYLQIDALNEGSEKESKKIAYSDALENFIITANSKGIAVDVEAGWRDWAEEGLTYKGDAIIDYAIEYNNSRSNKIRGVQFDVEPYLLPTYESNKAVVLKNFVAFVDQITTRIGSNSLRLSIVIPHFYDSSQKWTPAITYNGITTYTFDHLLRILDTRNNSSIILMSYRNFAKNKNGAIEISQVEVNTASNGNHPTKIIVAQETGDVEPDYVTFYGTSKTYLQEQINLINQAFGSESAFGGIAIHYLEPYLEL